MSFEIQKSDKILRVEDHSDFMMTRARIIFTNHCVLSIIYGRGSYGSISGRLEVDAWAETQEMADKVREIYVIGNL